MCVYVQSYGSVEEEQLSSENSKNGSKCFSVLCAPLVTRAGKKKIGQFLSQFLIATTFPISVDKLGSFQIYWEGK